MRRLLAVSIGVVLLLAGCSQRGEQTSIPPEEVLRNAAQASLVLDSVRYELRGSFELTDSNSVVTSGTLELDGVLQDAGEQVQFSAVLSAKTAYEEGDASLSADISVVVGGPQDLFVKVERFGAEGPNQLFNDRLVEQFVGKWWRIPAREDQIAATSVTPDPRLLNAQAQVVKVVRDRGMASMRGRATHRYDVAIDHEKLIAYLRTVAVQRGELFNEEEVRASIAGMDANGEIWIDAETYQLQRLRWDVSQGVSGSAKSVSAEFSVDFFDHDAAAPIVLPSDAEEFTPLMFFDAPSGLDAEKPPLPPEVEEDIMQQLLEQGASNPYQ